MLKSAALAGMSEAEFWACTPRYLDARIRAFEQVQQQEWERTRWLGFIMLKTVDSKNRVRRPEDVCRFPWEKERPRFVPQAREELEQFDREADEVLRLTQPEAYERYMAARRAAENAQADGTSN